MLHILKSKSNKNQPRKQIEKEEESQKNFKRPIKVFITYLTYFCLSALAQTQMCWYSTAFTTFAFNNKNN